MRPSRLAAAVLICLFCLLLTGRPIERIAIADGPKLKTDAAQQKHKPVAAIKPKPSKPFGLEKRIPWTTSHVVGSPDPPLPYRLVRRFPKLKFDDQPVDLVAEPGSNRLFVLQYSGKLISFDDNDHTETKTELYDFNKPGYGINAMSLAFHPNYQKNGYLYAFIGLAKKAEAKKESKPKQDTKNNNSKTNPGVKPKQKSKEKPKPKPESKSKKDDRPDDYMHVFRYQMSRKAPRTIIPDSETLIIKWWSHGHNGGGMAFGPDGCLYIGSGDGTSGSDPHLAGQDVTDLRSSILRIDVDYPDSGKPYGIPKDNPFLDVPGARGEIWAFGLRQPWRLSFDFPTGNLWVGEVGQDLWEMIHLVQRGGNYGWSVREGNHPFMSERRVGPAPISGPIVEHHHTESRSITGGFVYRGSKRKELYGVYIYCDYETGKVWGFKYEDGKVRAHRLLTDTTYHVAAFGRDHAGELYLVALSGELLELEPNSTDDKPAQKFPRSLSQTGLFGSVADHTPAPGMIPYAVNAQVWTDGAHLQRFLGVPGDGKISMNGNRGWTFPDGTVAVQTVSLETTAGDPNSRRRIETRLLTRQEGQWAAYTYRWNKNQTDADLVEAEGAQESFAVRDASVPGGVRQQTWHYPARTECMGCHSRAANWVLGLSTVQMNRDFNYGHAVDNQLRTFVHIGLPDKPLNNNLREYLKLVDPYDASADLNARARSYLHANCSHCHVSDGGGNARMELEFHHKNDATKTIDVVPLQGNFNIADGRLIAPGDPNRSVILFRISKLGRGRMPHLGSSAVDVKAVRMMHDWIAHLPPSGDGGSGDNEPAKARLAQQQTLAKLRSASASSGNQQAKSVDRLLSRVSGAMLLLAAINADELDDATTALVTQKASKHANDMIRDLFERFVPEQQRVKRLGITINPKTILALKGDASRGKTYFLKTAGVQCRNCHQINGQGKELGPDLSKIGKKLDRIVILENILDPSKRIDEKFATWLVQTTRGKIHTGLLVSKTDAEIVLKDGEHKLTRLPRSKVEEIIKQQKSLMPDQLLRDATPQQAADLVEYLSGLK